MRFTQGLFIGKFYPPHIGHHRGIREAATQCEHLTVLVMASVVETIPLSDRVSWLRDEHASDQNVVVIGVECDAPMDIGDSRVWAAQVAIMKSALRMYSTDDIDAVFSAEPYGSELAEWFGATSVAMNRDGPTSTGVRRDLHDSWKILSSSTHAGLTLRAVFVGAESTGTTSVSQAVAQRYRERGGVWSKTAWVAEFGREYTETIWEQQKGSALDNGEPPPELNAINWSEEDFAKVASVQANREESTAAESGPLLVCDNDAFATNVWQRRYLGYTGSTRVGRGHRVYFVTDHNDVSWLDDGLREGDLEIRAAMTEWFCDALTTASHSWVLLTGSFEERVDLAVRTIDQLLEFQSLFNRPLQGPGFAHSS